MLVCGDLVGEGVRSASHILVSKVAAISIMWAADLIFSELIIWLLLPHQSEDRCSEMVYILVGSSQALCMQSIIGFLNSFCCVHAQERWGKHLTFGEQKQKFWVLRTGLWVLQTSSYLYNSSHHLCIQTDTDTETIRLCPRSVQCGDRYAFSKYIRLCWRKSRCSYGILSCSDT